MNSSRCTDETHKAILADPERVRTETTSKARNNDPHRSRDGWRPDEVWVELRDCDICGSSFQVKGIGWKVTWLYAVGANRFLTLDAAVDFMDAHNIPAELIGRRSWEKVGLRKLDLRDEAPTVNDLIFVQGAIERRRKAREPKPFSESAKGTALLAAMGLGALAGFLQVVSGG